MHKITWLAIAVLGVGVWTTVGFADEVTVKVIRPVGPATQPGELSEPADPARSGEIKLNLNQADMKALLEKGEIEVEGIGKVRLQVNRLDGAPPKAGEPGEQPRMIAPAPRTGIQQLDSSLPWYGLTDAQKDKLTPILQLVAEQYRNATKDLNEKREDAVKRMQAAAGESWRLKEAKQDASKAIAENKAAAEEARSLEQQIGQVGEKLTDGAMDKILPVLTEKQAEGFKSRREGFLDTPELRAKRWAQSVMNGRFYGRGLTDEQMAKGVALLIKEYPEHEQRRKERAEKESALSAKQIEAVKAKDTKAQEVLHSERLELQRAAAEDVKAAGDRVVEKVLTKEQARRIRNTETAQLDTPDGKAIRFAREAIGPEAADLDWTEAQKSKLKDLIDTRELQVKEARAAAAKLTPEEHKATFAEYQKRQQELSERLKQARAADDTKAEQAVLDEMRAPARKVAEQQDALRKQVEALLTADQQKTLAEARGRSLASANQADVSFATALLAKMQLDDEQAKKVKDLADAAQKVLGSLPLHQRAERDEFLRQFRKDVYAVLTDAQKAEYRKSWGTP